MSQQATLRAQTRQDASNCLLTVILLGAVVAIPFEATAADTVETWSAGATDVDFYVGYDGAGAGAVERAVYCNLMLGYGLVDGLSAYLLTDLRGDGLLGASETSVSIGLFGTPVNTDHFDVDLFLDVGTDASGGGALRMTPSLELNFDARPDQNSWGAYLRVALAVFGRDPNVERLSALDHAAALSLHVNPGLYTQIANGHQLLLEYDIAMHDRAADAHPVAPGGLTLGYNVVLSDRIELINHVRASLPEAGQGANASVMVGLIATLAPPQP